MYAHEHHGYDPALGFGYSGVELNAEIFPYEGLDLILGIIPKGATTLSNTFLALFTAYTASTVGTFSSVADSYTEPSGGAYARVTIASSAWGAASTTNTSWRQVAASQQTFATASASWGTVNGFWIANQASATGDTCVLAANFDDTTAVTINSGDVIKVTPTWIAGS